MSTKVGALLERFMQDAGVDDTRLSRATNVAKANISRLKKDPKANPTLATLKPLAAFFGLTVSQLLGEAPLTEVNEQAQVRCRIPVLVWSSINSFIEKQQCHTEDWLSMEEMLDENVFAAIVSDKTMSPIFPLGSILIIEPKADYSDGMYVLMQGVDGGEPFLRQYLVDGSARLLKSVKLGANWVEPISNEMNIIGAIKEIRYKMESMEL